MFCNTNVISTTCENQIAGKVSFGNKSSLEYYEQRKEYYLIHEETKKILEELLHMLAENGEKDTFKYIKKELLKNK